jgi:hypothetical protein
MLVLNVTGVRFIFAGLRSAIRYGDPTKTANSEPADSSASGSEPGIPFSR